jgi:hypothetical protein
VRESKEFLQAGREAEQQQDRAVQSGQLKPKGSRSFSDML